MSHISTYLDYLPLPLLESLLERQVPVPGVAGLTTSQQLLDDHPALQTTEALRLVVEVYRSVEPKLRAVLDQRAIDRAFVDATTLAQAEQNTDRPYLDPGYQTVIGQHDSEGRLVVGPLPDDAPGPAVSLPAPLQGPTVTLFGPPDSAKMCINAMNALHRVRSDEPGIVRRLVDESGIVPRWGADSEDSKTPFVGDLLAATENLRGCFDRTLSYDDPRNGKRYRLENDRLSIPIKRIPGIAMPDGAHLLDGVALPLHLVDFVLHAWHNRDRAEALVFYVPKLENEEEAAYLATLVRTTEAAIAQRDPGFQQGAVRLFIVFETPRAIFRIGQMARALHPWFAGGSLGWHDFLGNTARLFRHDPNYRIPVKADPNIVIHHIRESHDRLVRALKPIGAVRIGGMYGTLPVDTEPGSFEVSMVGYVRDVVTQLRRGLDGFWVAHPDFVRIGIALVEAWRRQTQDDDDTVFTELVSALVPDPVELQPLLAFIAGDDVAGHDASDPLYPRRVLAADIVDGQVIANHDPEEVRYNVFQALQYLAAWLSGNGCVALPSAMTNQRGEPVFVRVMDDLATTERSRWEVWAEVAHGRVPLALFERILREELAFIQAGEPDGKRRVQVRWEGEPGRWYPIAATLLHQLCTQPDPPEAVTELLLPFTFDVIRDAAQPWTTAHELCPGRYSSPALFAP